MEKQTAGRDILGKLAPKFAEHNDEYLRNVKLVSTKVDNWENYDTILIGYPIWWGIAACQ